ncbi:CHAT domain-containing protein [Calothrix sp. 336/3]|uniref:CHAT domain-containing protein n=1 Tax=Calothrix sp. 336/3 TaxID=1337936 RepID=UPI0004E33DAF|nr:CHAT domain-containing protein [Calothrix sp. 336/3]AKG24555.1 tetratricopeptide TPR_1 repeat-containing protein [Calothrix sp. 336/3]
MTIFRLMKKWRIALICLLMILFVNSPTWANIPTIPTEKITSSLADGKALYDRGRYHEAAQVLQQVEQNYRHQGKTLELAVTLSNLSLAHQQLGNWTEARAAIAESLSILGYGKTENLTHPLIVAQSLDILGKLQLTTGEAETAVRTWQKSEKIYLQLKSGAVTPNRLNQAQGLRIAGNYTQAVKILEELGKNFQNQPDTLEKARALRSLGETLELIGNLAPSQTALTASLAIAQKLNSNADIAASLLSLGNNARSQQEITSALSYYQQAAATAPSTLLQTQAQLNQLSLLISAKKYTAAQTLIPAIATHLQQLTPSRAAIYAQINFTQSLVKIPSLPTDNQTSPSQILATAIRNAQTIGDKRAEAYGLGTLGGLYERNGQLAEAQKLTQQALLLSQGSNAPEISYRWQWQLGRLLQAKGNIPGAIAAYDATVSTLESLRSDLAAVNPEVQFNFRDSVEPVYRESVALLLQSLQGKADEKTLETARLRMEALQLAELDNFFREACLQGQKVILDQIVDKDNPTAAILYPIILPNTLQVIVKIPQKPLKYYSTPVSQIEVEKTISQLRQNLIKPSAIKAINTDSQKLYNWLIQPIASELQTSNVNTLVFVPDGALRNIPLASLYDGKAYLIEKYAVSLSVGLQLLNPKPLLRKQLNALTAGLTSPPANFSQFPPLPAIKAELQLITDAGVRTTQLLDQQFTTKALENKVNTAPFNILHLATHGEFSSRADKTFILAADGPINVIQFDSILRGRVQNKPDAVQLLVLSACQTAAGDNRAALGLAGAAIRAGAQSTVASLWQIDDESTAQFVGEFYQQLKNSNITKVEALRRAQLSLLKHPNYNAPSFWSAYVLIGNWL